MYKNFDDWDEYEGFSYGSGTSTQQWIIDSKSGTIGLFKERKSDSTTDNFSEKIASELAHIIGLECAKIDLAIRNGKFGLISYKINLENEIIQEGINYISKIYPYYNRDNLVDEKSNEKYSLDIILNSIKGLNLEKDLFKIFIFDCIIGNTDRHHSNWATIRNENGIRICPIYDNASSLCSYTTDQQINDHFNDNNWINAQVDSKSKSLIRLKGKKVRHSEFISYIKQNYYFETLDFVKDIKDKLTDNAIDNLLINYNNLLSDNKLKLLREYLIRKRNKVLEIYEIL